MHAYIINKFQVCFFISFTHRSYNVLAGGERHIERQLNIAARLFEFCFVIFRDLKKIDKE